MSLKGAPVNDENSTTFCDVLEILLGSTFCGNIPIKNEDKNKLREEKVIKGRVDFVVFFSFSQKKK